MFLFRIYLFYFVNLMFTGHVATYKFVVKIFIHEMLTGKSHGKNKVETMKVNSEGRTSSFENLNKLCVKYVDCWLFSY